MSDSTVITLSANAFIAAIIIALTQVVKIAGGKDNNGDSRIGGIITIVVAVIIGGVSAALAPVIGLEHITIAGGIMDALAAVGLHTTASSVNTNSK